MVRDLISRFKKCGSSRSCKVQGVTIVVGTLDGAEVNIIVVEGVKELAGRSRIIK